jgi:antirestriction protein
MRNPLRRRDSEELFISLEIHNEVLARLEFAFQGWDKTIDLVNDQQKAINKIAELAKQMSEHQHSTNSEFYAVKIYDAIAGK